MNWDKKKPALILLLVLKGNLLGRLFVPSEFQLCGKYSMLSHGSGSKSFEYEANTINFPQRRGAAIG